jgi:hypothetical protein
MTPHDRRDLGKVIGSDEFAASVPFRGKWADQYSEAAVAEQDEQNGRTPLIPNRPR